MTPDSARDDLAFLRSIVQAGDDGMRQFGEGYLVAGLCYGVQMLLHGAQLLGWASSNGLVGLAIAFGPTVVFTVLMVWQGHKHRHKRVGSVAGRAIGAVFAGVGFANLILIAIIGLAAWREQSVEVWLIYPCTVMVMQGAAWMVVWAVKRELFSAIVAIGWFAVSLAMGVSIGHPAAFVITTGLGLFLFMVIPGWIIVRRADKAA
jgi:hypothetical protein